MFVYCLNNAVNGADPCGRCFHHWNIFKKCEKCKEKKEYNCKYDVPSYKQGNGKVCWSTSQIMVESFYNEPLTNKEANQKIISLQEKALGPMSHTAWYPLNRGKKLKVKTIYDLGKHLSNGPLYAYYYGYAGQGKVGHYVVVTGIDTENNIVYTNNPWNDYGTQQTFEDFQQGFSGMKEVGYNMPLCAIYSAKPVRWD